MQQLLKLEQINYSYHSLKGETETLRDINLNINEGEFVAIVGPSGCGKSTLLSLISGLSKPETGKIYVKGTLIGENNITSYLRIGYMLQKDYLLEWRTIYKNVLIGLEINQSLTEENIEYINKLLKDYELYDFKDKKPSELSGGMKQRAALIRTMATKPELYLLDEPFSALDFQTRLMVSADIADILRKTHKTAILITHDLSEAITLADRIIVMSKRPAHVKCELKIDFEIERNNPIAIRNTRKYQEIFNYLWEAMTYEQEEC